MQLKSQHSCVLLIIVFVMTKCLPRYEYFYNDRKFNWHMCAHVQKMHSEVTVRFCLMWVAKTNAIRSTYAFNCIINRRSCNASLIGCPVQQLHARICVDSKMTMKQFDLVNLVLCCSPDSGTGTFASYSVHCDAFLCLWKCDYATCQIGAAESLRSTSICIGK